MISVAIFQYDLGIGGVQRSLINLLNNLNLELYNIDLYIFDDNNFYNDSIPSAINIIKSKRLPMPLKLLPFEIANKIFKNTFRINKKYDVSIDFNGYQSITAIGAINIPSNKKVLWIHNDISERLRSDFKYKVLWLLQRKKLEYFNEYVAVSAGIVDSILDVGNVGEQQIHVINNYVNSSEILKKSEEKIDFEPERQNYNLVSVGRLSKEKNIYEMLNILKKVISERSSIHIYIIGDGPEKQNLQATVRELGLQSFVDFLGAKSNPYPFMKKMDGLISTSLHEGQGISILEAKCLGIDIFIPPRLEKYTYKISGHEDIAEQLVHATRHNHAIDELSDYNRSIQKGLENLLKSGTADETK